MVTGSVGLFDVADTRVLQAFERIRTPPLDPVAEVAGVLATRQAIYVLWLANLLPLIVFRRWRHLFVIVVVGIIVVNIGASMAATLQRPRPFEVEIIGPWAGLLDALPAGHRARHVPARHRVLAGPGRAVPDDRASGWSAGCSTITALSRLYLGQDHPTDIAAGVILGVAVPLAAFRLITPNDVYPVRYQPRPAGPPRRHRHRAARRSSGRWRTSSGCWPPR